MPDRPSKSTAATVSDAASGTAATKPNRTGDTGLPTDTAAGSLRGDALYHLRFCCLEGAAYHAMRAGFYEKIHRGIMGTVVIAASGTIAAFGDIEPFSEYKVWWGLVPLFASTADLVFAPGSKAQTHAAIRARYFELLADIEEGDATESNCRRWTAALHRTYAAEPPITYRAVKAMAYNAAVDALHDEKEAKRKRLVIGFWWRILGRFLPLHATTYKPKEDAHGEGATNSSAG